ncbi:MAG: hypothetical protein GC164_00580 [Phycisphaera sp.]|nr:hypothetical protein [Phycisphaera sp.]
MQVSLNPEFDRVLERFEAWWNRQIIDRPLVSIGVQPIRPPASMTEHHGSLRERWMDAEYQIESVRREFESGIYLAETLPVYMPNLGPEVCATVFGCGLEFGQHTSWSKPIVENIREVMNLKPDLENAYWQTLRRMTRLSLEAGRGRWLTAMTDLHTNGDLLASLRDPQELCIDIMDDPEGVRLACEHVTGSFATMYEDLGLPIATAGQPSTGWTPVLHNGRMYIVSCDFICMISPDAFERTILPSIVQEMRYLDRSLFHLDGPGALKHLDALLACEELDALQWVYGAGGGRASDWIEVYRKAQGKGKALQVICADIPDALCVMEHLKPEGVWLSVGGRCLAEEARRFIDRVAMWVG